MIRTCKSEAICSVARECEGQLRKVLLLEENLSKPTEPSVSSRRLTGELQLVFVFSGDLFLLQGRVFFCPSRTLGVSKWSIILPKGEAT